MGGEQELPPPLPFASCKPSGGLARPDPLICTKAQGSYIAPHPALLRPSQAFPRGTIPPPRLNRSRLIDGVRRLWLSGGAVGGGEETEVAPGATSSSRLAPLFFLSFLAAAARIVAAVRLSRRREQAADMEQKGLHAVVQTIDQDHGFHGRLVHLPACSVAPGAFFYAAAAIEGVAAGKDGVEGKQRGRGVRVDGSRGKVGGLDVSSKARRAELICEGDDFIAAIRAAARKSKLDERAVRTRAVPQLRGEPLDCGVEGWGEHSGVGGRGIQSEQAPRLPAQ